MAPRGHFSRASGVQTSMAGYIKILRTDVATGTHGRTIDTYKLSYVASGSSWVRDFDFEGLKSFLIHSIGLTPEHASEAMNQAQRHGTSNVPGISIAEHEALAMDLTQLPSDEG